MDLGQITVKEILGKRLGEEKATKILGELNDAYQNGKRGEEMEKHFKDILKREKLDGDIAKVSLSLAIPVP